eukprot:Em0011g10a
MVCIEMMYTAFVIQLLCLAPTLAWFGDGTTSTVDRVLLEKLSAITLEQGKMTTARRVSAIPQLRCVGGSAGCHGWQPKVVQCLNRGTDGYDVQWECKTEMDEDYQFGRIQVLCEGFNSPNDPYVLRGSCGLEYELDWSSQPSYNNHDYHSSYSQSPSSQRLGFSLFDGIMIAVCCVATYWLLKCVCNPYRARSEYGSSTVNSGSSFYPAGSQGSTGGGGFWTGATTGGILGYLFGSRTTGPSYNSWGGWGRPSYSNYSSSRWSTPHSSSSHSSYRSSSGSRSRTTSGFGGTSRR